MKILIASDIHGSAAFTEMLVARIEREAPDKTVLLGDILYHGPRNDLPEGYNPKAVIKMLSPLNIVAVKGNCDGEVDDMVLNFPLSSESAFLIYGKRTVYFCHGHKTAVAAAEGDIVVSGHTHVPECREENGVYYLNPGSVSIPKEGSHHGYMVFEDGVFTWRDLISGEEIAEFPPLKV